MAGHKRPANEDSPRIIEQTRHFDKIVGTRTAALELTIRGSSCILIASIQVQTRYSFIVFGNSLPFGIKRMDNEFTHSRVFLFVKCSPRNSCPKCAPQFIHSISVLIPSGSGIRFIAFEKVSSKLGHPQPASNLLFEEKRGALHLRQINVPSS